MDTFIGNIALNRPLHSCLEGVYDLIYQVPLTNIPPLPESVAEEQL